MLVYDITDLDSFNALGSWLIEIEKYFKIKLEMLLRECTGILLGIRTILMKKEKSPLNKEKFEFFFINFRSLLILMG